MPRTTPAGWRRSGASPPRVIPTPSCCTITWAAASSTSMHSDRKAAAHIAKPAGVRSLVLNYRRSPEHKYPAQIEDVQTAYDWLLQKGYQPDKIASVGHSVGGNLAISLGLRLRDTGPHSPVPPVDLAVASTFR